MRPKVTRKVPVAANPEPGPRRIQICQVLGVTVALISCSSTRYPKNTSIGLLEFLEVELQHSLKILLQVEI